MPIVAAPGATPSMALHELVTNAAKYGAFPVHGGRVDAAWSRHDDSSLRLIWSEQGGPRVISPTRVGLGSGVIERTVRDQRGSLSPLWVMKTGRPKRSIRQHPIKNRCLITMADHSID